MKKILVTGGTGFIGRALVKRLIKEGYQVRLTTRRNPEDVKIENAEVIKVSFNDVESLKKAVEGCSGVFHLAALISGCSREEFEKANVKSTENVVSAVNAQEKKPEFFIYSSSLASGGPSQNPEMPRTEQMKDEPVSNYGRTKLAAETFVKQLDGSIKWTILRPPIVYGKNDAGISKVARWVKRGFMVNMCAGDVFFNFIYLGDLIEVMITAIKNPATKGQTYFVCENKHYPWMFFIDSIAKSMGKKRPIMLTLSPGKMKMLGKAYQWISKMIGTEPVFNEDKAVEACAGNWIASSKKWEKDTDWKGWTPLVEGLKETFGN
jgi:nucleoside-diphosphate-sugar epimerase